MEMFNQWPSWLSHSPRVRRTVIRLWRVLLRVQRATLANAVVVIRRQDGRLLTVASTSGELKLPTKELDGWRAVTTQVDEWLEELQPSRTPKLEAIDGRPGHFRCDLCLLRRVDRRVRSAKRGLGGCGVGVPNPFLKRSAPPSFEQTLIGAKRRRCRSSASDDIFRPTAVSLAPLLPTWYSHLDKCDGERARKNRLSQ
jgi:hypothetical protein